MRRLGKAGRSDWDSRHLGGEQEGFHFFLLSGRDARSPSWGTLSKNQAGVDHPRRRFLSLFIDFYRIARDRRSEITVTHLALLPLFHRRLLAACCKAAYYTEQPCKKRKATGHFMIVANKNNST